MNFLSRKNSQKPVQAGDEAAAQSAPPPPPAAIPDVPAVQVEPIALESLVAKEVVVKSVTATSVVVQYSLPPTSTKNGGPVDVKVLIRPSRLFKQVAADSEKLQADVSRQRMEFNMQNSRNMSKPGYNHHEAFQDLQRKIMPLQQRSKELWDDYAIKSKELVPLHPEASSDVGIRGYFEVDVEQNLCQPLRDLANVGTITVERSPEINTFTIKNLASNVFYEVTVIAKRNGKNAVEEGASYDKVWSPIGTPVGFSTKTAPWQLALEKAGLRHLIEPFTTRGYGTFESWMEIPQATKEELGIDAAADAQLSEILAYNGIITPAEQAKIDRERAEMSGVVNTLLNELRETQEALSTGDAVVEKTASNRRRGPKFGVIVSVRDKEASVRWEDPRTKDPSNSSVEDKVKVPSLQRTQFTLFLSHAQADAQNQVAHLSVLLRDRNAKIWFDMDSERLEARDMVRGILNSKVFLLYLTKSYFDRWFCRLEASIARELKKPIIIVYEPDERFGGAGDYVSLVNYSTKRFPEFREFLLNIEAIPMARRAFQRRAVVDEIAKRAGLSSASRAGSFSQKSDGSGSPLDQNGSEQDDLRQMILDLKMEINDLKSENRELRELVDGLLGANHADE